MNMKKLTACILVTVMLLTQLSSVAHAAGFTMPASLKVIEAEAFEGVQGMQSAVVQEGTTRIGSRAFADTDLQRIDLPSTVESIAEDAFAGCGDLFIRAPKGSFAYSWAEERGLLMPETEIASFRYEIVNGECTITEYIGEDTIAVVPDTIDGCPVTVIGREAFQWGANVTRVVLPDSIRVIEADAFMSVYTLEKINLPYGLTTIGATAFCGTALEEIILPDTVRSLGGECFADCTARTLVLPDGLTSVPDYAFCGSGITSLMVPDSVTTIGVSAFSGCENLKSVVLSKGLESIYADAFYYCPALETVTFREGLRTIGDGAFCECESLTVIELPESLEMIGVYAFAYNPNLQMVTVQPNCTAIGAGAFTDNAERFVLVGVAGSYAETYAARNKLTFVTEGFNIGDLDYEIENTDSGCTVTKYLGSAEDVVIPDTLYGYPVTAIGEEAFYENATMRSLTVPDGVKTIGKNAAYYCSLLERVQLPDSVETIGQGAFSYCYALTDINMPANLKTIGQEAFSRCEKLNNVKLPYGLETLGFMAFYLCKSLETAFIPATVTTLEPDVYGFCYALREATVMAASPYIPSLLFNGCKKLETIYIANGPVKMLDSAVAQCESLKSIVIPPSVTSVTDYTFYKTTGFTIYGEAGSYAEIIAASDETITFVPVDLTGKIAYSGVVQDADGNPVPGVQVRLVDGDSGNLLAMADSGSDGAWSAKIPGPTASVRIVCSLSGYTFGVNSLSGFTGADDIVCTAVYTGEAQTPEILSVYIPVAETETGKAVTMTVSTVNAASVILVVDGVRYETYPVCGGVAEITRSFSTGGSRSVQFIPVSAYGEGSASAAQVIKVLSKGVLGSAQVSCAESIIMGSDLIVSWSAIENADAYVLRVYDAGGSTVWVSDRSSELRRTVPAEVFRSLGDYTLCLSVVGAGYSQSDTAWNVTIETLPSNLELTAPADGATVYATRPVVLSADNPDGDHMAFRVTGEGGVEWYPAEGTLSDACPSIEFTPVLAGTYTVEAVCFAFPDRAGELSAAAPVTLTVKDGAVSDPVVGTGMANMTADEITSVSCETGTDITRVNVKMDGADFVVMTDYTDANGVRTFTKAITSPAMGLHTFTFAAEGVEEIPGAQFVCYVLDSFEGENAARYPATTDVRLISPYPVSQAAGSALNPYSPATVIGTYGDLWYIEIDGRRGYVHRDSLSETMDTSGLKDSLTLLLDDTAEARQYLPLSGVFSLEWDCSANIGSSLVYRVLFVNPEELTETYTLYTGSETRMSVAVADIPEGQYYVEVQLIDASGLQARGADTVYASADSYDERFFEVYNDENGVIDRHEHDSLNRLVNLSRDYVVSYNRLSLAMKDQYEEFISNPAFQTWSWVFGDTLDATQCDYVKAAYLSDAIMQSLSTYNSDVALIPWSGLRDLLKFIGMPAEVYNTLSEYDIRKYFEGANMVVVTRADGYYYGSSDSKRIKEAVDQIVDDYDIDLSAIKKIGGAMKIANKVQSMFMDYARYVSAPDYRIDQIIEGLDACGNSSVIQITRELLSAHTVSDTYTFILLAAIYLIDCGADAITDAVRNMTFGGAYSLLMLTFIGPFLVGIKAGAAIAYPIVDASLNINGIQAKTYRVLWAMEACDEFYQGYLDVIRVFEDAPVSDYRKMVRASEAFCMLYSNVIDAMNNLWLAQQDGLFIKFTNLCADIDIDVENQSNKKTVQRFRTYLKYACDEFYNDFICPVSGKSAYVSWN